MCLSNFFGKTIKVFLDRVYNILKPSLVIAGLIPFAANVYLPLGLGVASSLSGHSYVQINQEGKAQFFNTDKKTVRESLVYQGIFLDEKDKVSPPLDSDIMPGVNEINIIKARPVIIHDMGEVTYYKSAYLSSKDILKDLDIALYSGDTVFVANPLNNIVVGAEIFIDRSPVVTLQVDGEVKELHTRNRNIASLLVSSGVVLGSNDRVEPSLDVAVYDGLSVSVIRVSQSQGSETVDIPFTVEYKDDPTSIVGQSKIERAGVVGKKQVNLHSVVENGSVVSKNIISETVLQPPVSQLVLRGSKPKVVYVSGAYSDFINDAAMSHNLDPSRLSKIMMCESKGDAYAVGGGGRFFGLFQYLPSTWAGASSGAGFAGASIYDAKAQIYTTAWKISNYGYSAWPVCGK